MGGRVRLASILTLLALLIAGPAQAAWYRAETERFIVYGERSEERVREYAVKLTTFDAVLRYLNPGAKRPPGHKLEVYLVDGTGDLRRIKPGLPNDVRGFYVGNNEAVFAAAALGGGAIHAEQVLFHEYAHHFMLENFPAAYPAWFVEGWAEYYMTAKITPKTVTIGDYNITRVAWLYGANWLPLEDLLTKRPGELRGDQTAVYYSQAWLLMHYMRGAPERAAQLNAASLAISKGEDPVAAFTAATGLQPKAFQQRLQKYRKLQLIELNNNMRPPTVTVTKLPPSADDFLLENLRLMTSPTEPVDLKFLGEIRARAARHPGDRFADMSLARAEFTYGDVAAGEAIMKRLIEADPKDVDALVLAGVGQLIAGERNEDQRVARYRAARGHFGKAYGLKKDDFRALYFYARSRSVEPAYPNDNDLTALLEARALAPTVQEISVRTGAALIRLGRKEEAMRVLSPVINSPHNPHGEALAKALLDGKTLEEAQAAVTKASNPAPAPAKPDEKGQTAGP